MREIEDGRILLFPFCGCQTEDVLGALGLSLADLFCKPLGNHVAPSRSRIPAADVLACISADVDLVALIAADFIDRRDITELTWHQLAQAASRLGRARDHVA